MVRILSVKMLSINNNNNNNILIIIIFNEGAHLATAVFSGALIMHNALILKKLKITILI